MATTEMSPWRIFAPGRDPIRAPTREGAKKLASSRFPVGFVEIEHETSGESWVRETGNWRQRRPPNASAEEPAA